MTTAPISGRRERMQAQGEEKPYRWALSSWAQAYRRIARPWTITRHVRRFCQPLTVEGRENLKSRSEPAHHHRQPRQSFRYCGRPLAPAEPHLRPHSGCRRCGPYVPPQDQGHVALAPLQYIPHHARRRQRGAGLFSMASAQRLVAPHLPGREAHAHRRASAVPPRPRDPCARAARAGVAYLH